MNWFWLSFIAVILSFAVGLIIGGGTKCPVCGFPSKEYYDDQERLSNDFPEDDY